jgi:catechol 2,3-dioxygenase-like lactoylglutathione lyase family enzyme
MTVNRVATQIRTTNLDASIDYYVSRLGFELDFRFRDFYAGIKVTDDHSIHLKLVDEPDPSIRFVQQGDHLHLFFEVDDADATAERLRRSGAEFLKDLDETAWGTREFYVLDDQGHVLCFAQSV